MSDNLIPIIRSWPKSHPYDGWFDRGIDDDHVIDNEWVDNYDFRVLIEHYSESGVIHLDWDVAVDWADLQTFRVMCAMQPGSLRIIPYRLYKPTTDQELPVWAHHRNPVAFGCIYLPPQILQAWTSQTPEGQFNDTTLEAWLRTMNVRPRIYVEHHLRAVHLHY